MSRPEDRLAAASVAKRLDRTWFSDSLDSRLDLIATLGESGLPVALGLLVDGTVIRGVIGPRSQATESITDAVARAVTELFPTWPPETASRATDALRDQEERIKSRRQEDQEVFDRYFDESAGDFTLDDVALEDVAHVTRATRSPSTISVQQASIEPPNGAPLQVSFIQVQVKKISAWWVLDDEDDARVNYSPRGD